MIFACGIHIFAALYTKFVHFKWGTESLQNQALFYRQIYKEEQTSLLIYHLRIFTAVLFAISIY